MKYIENRETMANIATLYYLGEFSQEEIASMYHISRFKVSRILKKCKTMRIVEFNINNRPSYHFYLGQQLLKLFSLSQVIVTPSGHTPEESKENVACEAGKFLLSAMQDGMQIGISWGSTIQKILGSIETKIAYENSTFVQLSGNLCTQSIDYAGYLDGREIVQTLAAKTHAKWSLLQVPYIVQNPQLKELLLKEPEICNHMQRFSQLDMAVVGVGSSLPEKSVSYLSGYITLEESNQLLAEGMGADICGTRVSIDGEIKPTILTNRVLSIDLPILKQTPCVIAVAANADKAMSLFAGIKGGYFTHIIIDEIAALSLINLAKTHHLEG